MICEHCGRALAMKCEECGHNLGDHDNLSDCRVEGCLCHRGMLRDSLDRGKEALAALKRSLDAGRPAPRGEGGGR